MLFRKETLHFHIFSPGVAYYVILCFFYYFMHITIHEPFCQLKIHRAQSNEVFLYSSLEQSIFDDTECSTKCGNLIGFNGRYRQKYMIHEVRLFINIQDIFYKHIQKFFLQSTTNIFLFWQAIILELRLFTIKMFCGTVCETCTFNTIYETDF